MCGRRERKAGWYGLGSVRHERRLTRNWRVSGKTRQSFGGVKSTIPPKAIRGH